MRGRRLWGLLAFLVANTFVNVVVGEVRTWDGRHSIEKIDVFVVYFVPNDRQPLTDWKRRVDYFCRRIEQFHELEYDGQSVLKTTVEAKPFVSRLSTRQLREGDGDAIFFRTLREVDAHFDWNESDSEAFPIVLVLSEINWRPLDDFYRLRQTENGLEFEGQFIESQHFPGATSGGARATYLSREGKGWGLVSADGWRVPYRGSDCVVYHEGVGHTIGLPHPEPGNGSVMSFGQYRGWISESWLDKDQKVRLGWEPQSDTEKKNNDNLFRQFRAIPDPLEPKPGDEVSLKLDLPFDAIVQSCIAEVQTDVHGPWLESTSSFRNASRADLSSISLGRFDRHTPVSYRVKVTLEDGRFEELWGDFQVGKPHEIASEMSRSVLLDEGPKSPG
ncbi:hypothetical protein KOR42_11700 [Thalassoglobus neptunius]|uniref:Uncharacterized protein n=2 Tax=Thalassoglobus neptunius TaxID=1938619 RepID=A0A5C5X6A5_9PLAN|nr:hypothetical protein KOR42_11700 [Thalassoglobus neptunius]